MALDKKSIDAAYKFISECTRNGLLRDFWYPLWFVINVVHEKWPFAVNKTIDSDTEVKVSEGKP